LDDSPPGSWRVTLSVSGTPRRLVFGTRAGRTTKGSRTMRWTMKPLRSTWLRAPLPLRAQSSTDGGNRRPVSTAEGSGYVNDVVVHQGRRSSVLRTERTRIPRDHRDPIAAAQLEPGRAH